MPRDIAAEKGGEQAAVAGQSLIASGDVDLSSLSRAGEGAWAGSAEFRFLRLCGLSTPAAVKTAE